MADFFTSIEFWTGLTVVVLLFVLLGGGGKSMDKRIGRITSRKRSAFKPEQVASLRRLDPNANSAIGQMISNFSFSEKLRARLEMAGMQVTYRKLLLWVAGLFVGTMLLLVLMDKSPLVGFLFGLVVAFGGPNFVINRKIKKRKLKFIALFPDAIELIVRGLRAGLPVAESFQTVSREIPAPVAEVFALVSQQIGLGVPMEKALVDVARKLDLTEFDFFVTTIILQRETGGNLGEILSNLAEVLRQRKMMKLKIGAMSSEARASAYIVGSLPFIVFGILSFVSPDYVKPLFDDYRGNIALAGGGMSLLMGAVIMRKMTQFEI